LGNEKIDCGDILKEVESVLEALLLNDICISQEEINHGTGLFAFLMAAM
jgi:hypothetical protein